ncbi:hypothetical protein R3P38DRAFT_797355 [Favolaschia claudopus]|uniref:MYND-type domain-containing protein n=1 Tax=Favolaschia claudopus TaxID=2862362 RepID=A0AAV9Z2Z6_9AGAR
MPLFLLSKSQLAQIPSPLQRVATLAADPSTSPERVSEALYTLNSACLTDTRGAPRLAVTLLPLIHGILDPKRLPLDYDDAASGSAAFVRSTALCAYRAIILLNQYSEEDLTAAMPSLWPRIWRWIQLMDNQNYFNSLSPLSTFSRPPLFELIRAALAIGFSGEATGHLVHSTDDVGLFIARTWADMVSDWEQGRFSAKDYPCQLTLHTLSRFFVGSNKAGRFRERLEELCDGLGGAEHFGRLVMRTVSLLVQNIDRLQGPRASALAKAGVKREVLVKGLSDTLVFISRTHWRNPRPSEYRSFWQDLAHVGFIRFIVDLTRTLAGYDEGSFMTIALAACLHHLLCFTELGDRYLHDALKAGLLVALRSALWLYPANDPDFYNHNMELPFLFRNICVSMHQYASVRAIAAALPEALDFHKENLWEFKLLSDAPKKSWINMILLAQERVEILKQFRQSEFVACSNVECHVLQTKKKELKCCARCRRAFYCSKECQTTAWKSHGHRIVCKNWKHFPSRNRNTQFLFFTLLQDYIKHTPALLLQKLAYIYHTGHTNFCILFRYEGGRCTRTVVPAKDYKGEIEQHSSLEGDNKSETHVMHLTERGTKFALALRCSTLAVREALCSIAREIPEGTDVLKLESTCPMLFQQVKELAKVEVVQTYEGDANMSRFE